MTTQTDLTLHKGPDLIVFDVETTGADPERDRIVELGVVSRCDGVATELRWLINPQRKIPPEATEIHGISDSQVQGQRTFAQAWREIEAALGGSVPLCAYNGLAFDLPLLNAEIKRLHPMEGAQEVGQASLSFKPDAEEPSAPVRAFAASALFDPIVFVRWEHRWRRKRDLENMCEAYGIPTGRSHSALDDARATLALVDAMIVDGSIPSPMSEALRIQDELAHRIEAERRRFSYWLYFDRKTGGFRMGAGKHCGKLLVDVPASYMEWCASNIDDLPDEVREIFSTGGR